jgi:predicted dehydrogenase
MSKYKIGIIGCGLIGNKRAKALEGNELTYVADTNEDLAKKLAAEYNCRYSTNYLDLIKSDLDIVIVSTSNNMLIPVALDAVKHHKHVLIEKPGARNPTEMKQLIDAVHGTDIKIKVGFNHRYHPAIMKAKEIIKSNDYGEIMFIRARYGHGGRIGYDKEWRAKKAVSGGGELLDQGCHLIDLGTMFLGEFSSAIGYTQKYFWDMEVEDNGFALLKTSKGQVMQMHASWTDWKNIFSFEIMCKTAKIEISGLGKSYGTETLTIYRMKPEMGPPDKEVFTFDGEDNSWNLEFADFIEAIKHNKKLPDLDNAYRVIKTIYEIYDWNDRNN